MNLETKKQRLVAVKKELEQSVFSDGWVVNVGNVFFVMKKRACVLRDVVYYRSLVNGIEFEVLDLEHQYFVGSKGHAMALFNAFGGRYFPSDHCFLAENPRDLWIWMQPENKGPMELEDAKIALF